MLSLCHLCQKLKVMVIGRSKNYGNGIIIGTTTAFDEYKIHYEDNDWGYDFAKDLDLVSEFCNECQNNPCTCKEEIDKMLKEIKEAEWKEFVPTLLLPSTDTYVCDGNKIVAIFMEDKKVFSFSDEIFKQENGKWYRRRKE